MKRARTLFVLLLALATVASLSAARLPAPARAHSRDVVTITWMVSSDVAFNPWCERRIAAFNKANPSIHAQLLVVPYAQYDTKFASMWAAGSAPDVFSQWGVAGFRDYLLKGTLLDETPYISADAAALHLSDIAPYVRNLYRVNGRTYGIPQYNLGTFILYNTDLFKKAGVPEPPASWDDKSWTWDKMVADATKLTHDYGNPTKAQYGLLDQNALDAVPWQWDTNIFDPQSAVTGIVKSSHLTAPGSVAAYQAFADLIYKDKVMPGPALQQGFSTLPDPLMSGRVAMEIGAWAAALWTSKTLKWSIAPMPWVKKNTNTLYSDPWFISAHSQHPQQAWALIKYILSLPVAATMVTELHIPSSHQSLLPLWYQQFPGVPAARMRSVIAGSLKYGQESNNHMLANWGAISYALNSNLQPILLGQKSAAQQLPIAQANLNRVITLK